MGYNQYDNRQYNQYNNPYNSDGDGNGQFPLPRPSDRMELAAAVLGSIAVICCVCWYVSIPCGALAIILANLSRGGRTEYTLRAQVAIFLGIVAVVLCLVIYGITFMVELYQYGGLDGLINAYEELLGQYY
ncbi:MAG: hypothetical protein LUI02_01450 [Clostridiales bacterium]|nr:hypothetical protein [Clostridiales bacterium]